MLAETPHLIAHKQALARWRSLPQGEQIARISSLAPDRPPAPAGGRVRVGIWCPCILDGGAETQQLAMAGAVDADRVAWSGACVIGGAGIAHSRSMDALREYMPISAGIEEARELAARCEVLVSWAGIDPAPILKGLDPRPRVVYLVHFPAAGYGGRPPVPAESVDEYVGVSELCLDAAPRATVIWNAVDPDRLRIRRDREVMRRAWGIPVDAPVAAYLGRLAPEKDPEAMARLASSLPEPWHVAIVGAGPLRARLESARSARCHFLGPDPAPGDVLNAADALVVPSRYESFGLTIAEGLWMGLPVVSTRVGVAKLAPGLTREVPIGADGPTLAAALLADLADPEGTRERVERGRAFARGRASLERFGDEWTRLLCKQGEIARRLRVAACPDRGPVLPLSLQDDCGCQGKELSECRASKGRTPGRVTIRECLQCVAGRSRVA